MSSETPLIQRGLLVISAIPKNSATKKQAHRSEDEPIDRTLVARMRAAIPNRDTRSLTGRLLGDPEPTDQRRARAQASSAGAPWQTLSRRDFGPAWTEVSVSDHAQSVDRQDAGAAGLTTIALPAGRMAGASV